MSSMAEPSVNDLSPVVAKVLEQANATRKFCVAIVGHGEDHDRTLRDEQAAFEDQAQAVAEAVRGELGEPEPVRFALVEQMGHRSTTAAVRETTFLGKQMLEVTSLRDGSVHLVAPESLYEVTWLTEAEARQRAKPWTATAITAGQQLAYDEDAEADDLNDLDDEDVDPDEGEDDGMSAAEREKYDRDAEFALDAADEARDLEREAEADL